MEKGEIERKMEKAKEYLTPSQEELDFVSRLKVTAHLAGVESSFFEDFALNGIRVDLVEPGLIAATFKVPPRLVDRTGKMASGAIVNLVDIAGWAVVFADGLPNSSSVDMSISFLAPAKAHDELEITSKVLGKKGRYSGTIVLIRNKATGEAVAEGRHSLFGKKPSKL